MVENAGEESPGITRRWLEPVSMAVHRSGRELHSTKRTKAKKIESDFLCFPPRKMQPRMTAEEGVSPTFELPAAILHIDY
ncbi:MAG: hypothetical protein ACLFUS_15885 [Candidatus Sumerlaeia bacterium]